MILALKIVGMLVAGAGGVMGIIFGVMSWMDCGDEIAGGLSDGCFGVAFLGAALFCLVRWGHFLTMAY